ncbi:alpha/beta fold hydrolase [Pseudonocardia sp. RS11V-5]|uniref:alpha/beta fold hydrolase n=1 Tax=Pseudonocardia terrae TaxID=2905831 RepID=UPI001E387566|nr:alpha/beta hydrolase [Pseudonocardia terrae]MCE3556527.1 alpha/beta fold hydrolase [Pseudonocardia terrae]
MWIYRGRSGRSVIQSWCRQRLAAWPLPHRQQQVRGSHPHDHRSAHLVIAGEQHRRTVVVVPGRHGNAAVLTELVEALSSRYRVVAVDVPGEAGLGSGGRPNTERLRAYGTWLDELLATVARECTGGITVLAHGFGAAVALAARPAPHIAGLVLLNPYGFVRPAVDPRVAAALLAWRLAPTAAASARLLARLGGRGFVAPRALIDWLRLVGRHVATSSTPLAQPEPAHRWRWTPCTVAVGEHDPLFGDGRLVRPVRRALRTSVVTVPDAGSLLPYENPEAVLSVLRLHEAMHRPHPRARRTARASAPGPDRAGRPVAPHQAGRPPGTGAASRPPRRRRPARGGNLAQQPRSPRRSPRCRTSAGSAPSRRAHW